MSKTALSVKNLSIAYGNQVIYDKASLEIPQGELVGILGPNGAGKSTLVKAIINPDYQKHVQFDPSFYHQETDKNNIAYIPQRTTIDWNFPISVNEVVLMGASFYKKIYGRYSKEDKKDALEALEMVDLSYYKDQKLSNLSGGQQQRVFIARALMQKAQLLILDEPFAGVDIVSQKIIIDILKNLCEYGKTVMIVHHDLQTVQQYFSWVLFLNRKVIANGPTSSTFNEENIQKTFHYINNPNYVK